MSRPALSRRADARWWWCRYAGSSIASPPFALCVRCRSFRLQRCSCTRLDTLHQRGPGRTLARSERGGGVQQGGSVGGCTLVSRGWGQRETLRSHESRAEDCRAPQARCRPNLIRVRPGPNDCYLCATTIICVSLYAQCAVHSRHRQSSSGYASSSTRLRRPQCGGRRQIGGTSLAPSTEHSQGLSLYCLSGDLAGDLVTSRHDCCMGA
jgi:hypothetical protein